MGRWSRSWFAGLPAAVRGWTLEAIKAFADDPPAISCAGYNEAHTATAGSFFQNYFRNSGYPDFMLAIFRSFYYNNQVFVPGPGGSHYMRIFRQEMLSEIVRGMST